MKEMTIAELKEAVNKSDMNIEAKVEIILRGKRR